MRILDFHIHVIQPVMEPGVKDLISRSFGDDAIELNSNQTVPEQLAGLLDSAGVELAVVLAEYCAGITCVTTNEEVAAISRQSPRLIPFANIHPHLVVDVVRELEYCVEELGCRGLKLLPSYQNWHPLDRRYYALYDAAQALGIPVLFHTGSSVFPNTRLKYADPQFIGEIASDFPRLVLVQAHSGRGFWYDRAFFLSRVHDNVYMEVSGLPPKNLLKYFPEFERNGDKIIFGTDWPSTGPMNRTVQSFLDLPIAMETKEKIVWKNAARILGLD